MMLMLAPAYDCQRKDGRTDGWTAWTDADGVAVEASSSTCRTNRRSVCRRRPRPSTRTTTVCNTTLCPSARPPSGPSISVHRVDEPSVASTASAQRIEARNSIGYAGRRRRSHKYKDWIRFSERNGDAILCYDLLCYNLALLAYKWSVF